MLDSESMSTISIAIVSSSNEVAVLKVLRSCSSASVALLRRVIGSREPALVLSTHDYPVGMGSEEGQREQQGRIVEICSRLEDAGAVLELGYSPTPDGKFEVVNRAMMMNLFDSDIAYLGQERD